MRVLVVTNPHATATTARVREVILDALRSEAELEVEETANRGHAAALACRAMRDGTDVVVAFGGDGTVNEVVNGLLTDGVHPDVPALGVVPTGSTNVFARALGLPNDPIEATGALLTGLRHPARRRSISLGRVDDRWFVFAASFGFSAAIVAGVERRRSKGQRSSPALYARVGLREFVRTDRRHPRLHVELPDGTSFEDIHFALVTNTDPWTYVGARPVRPAPEVTLDSDLGVYARRRMSAPGLLLSLGRMLGDTPHIGRFGAYVRDNQTELTIRADQPLPVEVDGDYLGTRDKLTFQSQRRAINVIV